MELSPTEQAVDIQPTNHKLSRTRTHTHTLSLSRIALHQESHMDDSNLRATPGNHPITGTTTLPCEYTEPTSLGLSVSSARKQQKSTRKGRRGWTGEYCYLRGEKTRPTNKQILGRKWHIPYGGRLDNVPSLLWQRTVKVTLRPLIPHPPADTQAATIATKFFTGRWINCEFHTLRPQGCFSPILLYKLFSLHRVERKIG